MEVYHVYFYLWRQPDTEKTIGRFQSLRFFLTGGRKKQKNTHANCKYLSLYTSNEIGIDLSFRRSWFGWILLLETFDTIKFPVGFYGWAVHGRPYWRSKKTHHTWCFSKTWFAFFYRCLLSGSRSAWVKIASFPIHGKWLSCQFKLAIQS